MKNTIKNADEFLDDHGEPDADTITALEHDDAPEAHERLLELAERYNIPHASGMSASELSDAIQLAMDQEDAEQLQ